MTANFADRLNAAVLAKKSPVVVGLDPHLDLLPPPLSEGIAAGDRQALAAAVGDFCCGIIDALHALVPAVKPQAAFFERLGPAGWQALEAVVAHARAQGLVVISDAKRGDIGSTARAYADYHLGGDAAGLPGLGADAVTVNPYLGADSLQPFLDHTAAGRGLYLLAKTSNPGSSDLQDRDLEGAALYQRVAAMADDLGAASMGEGGWSAVGIVVGATHPEIAADLRRAFPRTPFLVPGYGAQGAGADDVAACFDAAGLGALVNASRSIVFAYRRPEYDDLGWQEAAAEAATAMNAGISAACCRRRAAI